MLRHEDGVIHGPHAAGMHADEAARYPGLRARDGDEQGLVVVYAMHRMTLAAFGFDTSDDSVANYRRICRTYYRGPRDYDAEVLAAVTYLRENRLLYNDAPRPAVGQLVGPLLQGCLVQPCGSSPPGNLWDVVRGCGTGLVLVGGFSST
jgi:hypothetical protein